LVLTVRETHNDRVLHWTAAIIPTNVPKQIDISAGNGLVSAERSVQMARQCLILGSIRLFKESPISAAG